MFHSLDYGAPSQAEIELLKADVQQKRHRYNRFIQGKKYKAATQVYGGKAAKNYKAAAAKLKAAWQKALDKLNAARAERKAAAAPVASSGPSISEMVQSGLRPAPAYTPSYYAPRPTPLFARGVGVRPAYPYAASGREALRRKLAIAEMQRKVGYTAAQEDAEMGALAMELGALEMELNAIHAEMGGDDGFYGDLGADGREVALQAGTATAAGAGGAAAGAGAYALATGTTYSTAFIGAGSLATGVSGAGLVAATAIAAPAALLAGGAAWALSWRASAKNIARLTKKIKALQRKMKLKVSQARSKAHARRLKRRYQRRIDRAKKRLDRIKRVLRRRIQRAKRQGNDDKVKRLRAMRKAAKYGVGRKKMLARMKRRKAKRAKEQGDDRAAAALEAEAQQIEALPAESFVTEQDYELDPELAAQLGPGALAAQEYRMAQGLPPSVTQASIHRANVINALARKRRQVATGYDDDDLLDETSDLDSYDDSDLGAASMFRDEDGKIKPWVIVAGVGGAFAFWQMRKKKGK